MCIAVYVFVYACPGTYTRQTHALKHMITSRAACGQLQAAFPASKVTDYFHRVVEALPETLKPNLDL